jgi:SAM-dependent methyltransferase
LARFGHTAGVVADLGAGSTSLFPETFQVLKLDLVVPAGVSGPFLRARAEQLPFRDQSLDGIGLFDLLEHMPDPVLALKEAQRVVRPGGFVIATVPAFSWLWSPHDTRVGHQKRYTRPELVGEISAAGFVGGWSSYFYGFLILPALARKVLRLTPNMSMPRRSVNRALSWAARNSIDAALRRRRAIGLSICALAVRA